MNELKEGVAVGGVYTVEHIRNGKLLEKFEAHNIIVNEGLNDMLNVQLHGTTQHSAWYVGLFEGNYTPVATDTAATIASNSTECTAYDETVRQAWVEAAASGQSISNSASKATFTINATKTLYGAFLISDSTKGGTAGVLFSALKFPASRAVLATDQFLITYTLSAASA